MNDSEYLEITRLIRDHLKHLGLDDIADFSNYAEYESDDPSPIDARTLIKLMLAAFDRYLVANASETVQESLRILAVNIDEGTPPEGALVHARDDRSESNTGAREPTMVAGLPNTVEMREALGRLERFLLEDFEPSGRDGGTA